MQVPLSNDPLFALLQEQIKDNRHLIWMTWGIVVLTWGVLALQAAHLLRRFFGARVGAADFLDDLDVKTFRDRMDKHDQLVAQVAETVTATYVTRFNAIDKQLEISRRKDNTLLVIMRDVRAFMIYGKRPKQEWLPIEEDAQDGPRFPGEVNGL